MKQLSRHQPAEAPQAMGFDAMMAKLLVLVTHHSLTGCRASITPIMHYLNALTSHADLEHFPEQRVVLAKMRQLWMTEQFRTELRH